MTFRALNPASAKIYYALEADRPITTLNIPDGSLVIFTDSGLEDSFDAVSNAWFNREQIAQTSGGKAAGLISHPDAFAQERNAGTSNQYGVGVDECNYHAWATATGDEQVSAAPALVFGVLVTVAITGTINIEDGTDDTGTVVLTIPTTTAVGTFFDLKGAKFNTGIFIDDASTVGSIVVLWRPQ